MGDDARAAEFGVMMPRAELAIAKGTVTSEYIIGWWAVWCGVWKCLCGRRTAPDALATLELARQIGRFLGWPLAPGTTHSRVRNNVDDEREGEGKARLRNERRGRARGARASLLS